jgi:transcriptional regulator with XRE-family HTH domain
MFVNHLRPSRLIGDDLHEFVLECRRRNVGGDLRRGMDEAAWKAFGEWVEQLRVRSGLQVGEVAERAGVSRVWLQEIRNGGRGGPGGWRLPNPKNEALVRLAHALNVSPEELLARAGRGAASGAAEAEGRPASSSSREGASAAERIRELEERVAQQERELAELRELLQHQAKRADAG